MRGGLIGCHVDSDPIDSLCEYLLTLPKYYIHRTPGYTRSLNYRLLMQLILFELHEKCRAATAIHFAKGFY